MPEVDHQWIAETFFHSTTRGSQFDFTRVTKLWYEPPQPSLSIGVLSKMDRFFGHRLFLWMPRHLFHVHLKCPQGSCTGYLTNAGVHRKTRQVLDIDGYYIMAGEYLACSLCHKKVSELKYDFTKLLCTVVLSTYNCLQGFDIYCTC